MKEISSFLNNRGEEKEPGGAWEHLLAAEDHIN